MNILVTGGAGFIGSALIRYIIEHTQYNVVNVDKLTYAGNLSSLKSVSCNARYHFEQVDICDANAVASIFARYQPRLIMHLAAESHVDKSITGPGQFIQTNVVGTYILLEQALKHWQALSQAEQNSFRFHHISTDEVYGDLPHPTDSSNNDALPLFTEHSRYQPSSPYSASKASSDHLVRAWHKTYGLPIVVTNCSNNYGPCQFPEKLIPLSIINALNGEPLPIYGKGNQIRDWLFVNDHAQALLLAATKGKIGDTYNIGGHNEKQNIDVVTAICELLDQEAPSMAPYSSLICHVADRRGHDRRYAINASKIESELGWKPQETFETGLRKTIQWYLSNKPWWQALQQQHSNKDAMVNNKTEASSL